MLGKSDWGGGFSGMKLSEEIMCGGRMRSFERNKFIEGDGFRGSRYRSLF